MPLQLDTGDLGSSRCSWSPVFMWEKLRVWQVRQSRELFGTGLCCLQEQVMSTPAPNQFPRRQVLWCLRSANLHFILVPSRECWSVLPPRQHSGTHPEGSVIPKSHPPLVFSRLATSMFTLPSSRVAMSAAPT